MSLLPDVFFCLLVDGPITGEAYKPGGLYGAAYGKSFPCTRFAGKSTLFSGLHW